MVNLKKELLINHLLIARLSKYLSAFAYAEKLSLKGYTFTLFHSHKHL